MDRITNNTTIRVEMTEDPRFTKLYAFFRTNSGSGATCSAFLVVTQKDDITKPESPLDAFRMALNAGVTFTLGGGSANSMAIASVCPVNNLPRTQCHIEVDIGGASNDFWVEFYYGT